MAGNYWRFVSAALLSGALLAGCSGGEEAVPASGNSQPPPVTTPASPTPSPAPADPASAPPVAGVPTPAPASPAPGSAQGVAVLNWNVPTEFTDGSQLPATELAGFSVYHGDSAETMAPVAEVDARATTVTLNQLTAGTHYFAVAAIGVDGAVGELSAVLSKTVL